MALAVMLLAAAVPFAGQTAYAAMPYTIGVDVTNQIVTVYKTSDGSIVRQMICSTGKNNRTPLGDFILPQKHHSSERSEWYYFYIYECWAQYATRIEGGVLFHSIPCSQRSASSISRTNLRELGTPASHGCVRLLVDDAKFIAQNCGPGTRVHIYESGEVNEDLRELLLQHSYVADAGQTYEEYFGMSTEEGTLGRFSKGKEVYDLQYRLRDLGIFADEVTGDYRSSTVNAVRKAQELMGEEQTGLADQHFLEEIYSEDAPTAMNGRLDVGTSGPVVTSLQESLTALRLYDGPIDSVYDVDVVEAVKAFQSAYGYSPDGVADSEVQQAIYYEAGRIRALFTSDSGYSMEKLEDAIYTGTVNCTVGIRIREKPSKESRDLGRLRLGANVVAIERGDEWSKIMGGGTVGYVKNVYVDYNKQDIYALRYTSADGAHSYTIGFSAAEYFAGAKRPSDTFAEYLAAGGSLDEYEGMSTFATVTTASDDITLNLREEPSTESEILAALTNGTQARVMLRSREWSMVKLDGMTGYLLNDYLDFWIGPEDALGPVEEEEPEDDYDVMPEEMDEYDIQHALVKCANSDRAPVYAEDSADTEVLGALGNGLAVDVLRIIDDWCYISYQGRNGYMREDDLQFLVDGVAV